MSIFFAPSPSSVDYATSAGSAGLATSSTSALNAAQAPNGFIVTGTLSATTVSATTYLNLGNTTAQWNASAIQSSPLSATLVPTTNQVLVYNGSVWTASTITTGGGGVTDHGALTGLADDDHPQYVLSATNNALSSTVSNHIASASVHFTQAEIDHGTILGLGDNDHPQYVLSSTNNTLSSLVNDHIASATVHFTQAQIDHGSILGLADNDHPQYVLSSTNNTLSSTVSNHLVSAVHWDLATLNTNYINASGDSVNSAFYFQTVSAATVSATIVSAAEAIYVDGATGYLINPTGNITLSSVGGTIATNTTMNVANGSGNIFLRAGRAGIYTDTAASAYYIATNNYADPRVNYVVAQTSAGDSYLGAKSGQTLSIIVPSKTVSSIVTADKLVEIASTSVTVRTPLISTTSIEAVSVSATNYLNLPQSDASSLRASPLSATLVPTAGQALMYNGSVWTASAALFAYTYGSSAPTGGSDGDIYLQTDVVALQIPSVSATNLSATNGDLSSIKLTDYSESKSSPTISASALTLNLNNSQVFTVALNSNISTLTISNVESRANTAQGFTLILTADGTARTITWPASIKWPSGTGPTLTSTNNKVDILSFLTPDNGTTWYGFVGGQNF
jgi:hypothetical protein